MGNLVFILSLWSFIHIFKVDSTYVLLAHGNNTVCLVLENKDIHIKRAGEYWLKSWDLSHVKGMLTVLTPNSLCRDLWEHIFNGHVPEHRFCCSPFKNQYRGEREREIIMPTIWRGGGCNESEDSAQPWRFLKGKGEDISVNHWARGSDSTVHRLVGLWFFPLDALLFTQFVHERGG